MAPFDDWNTFEDDQDAELEDASEYFQGKDALLFCIDASEDMLAPRESRTSPGERKGHVQAVLEIAVQLQKRKVVTSPNDLVGIMFYNTAERSETKRGAEMKNHCYVYQPIAQINAESIQQLATLMHDVKQEPQKLSELYPPKDGPPVPVGDVFTSCNWVIRDGAPKTGMKRIFLVTNNDDPHPGNPQYIKTARTTFDDLSASGVMVMSFFIAPDQGTFDRTKFWNHVLPSPDAEDENATDQMPDVITELDSLVQEMKIREMAKRSIFSIPMHLADGFTIGVKGYGLVTQQTKPNYKYFSNERTMEEAKSKVIHYDPEYQKEYDKSQMLFGMTLGSMAEDSKEDDDEPAPSGVRSRVFFTADDVKSFRTLDLQPGLKLLGFKDSIELAFEDNIKHSVFLYPDEVAYSGSTRTFSALLKTMLGKDKIGLVLGITRRNSAPTFFALMPQAEKLDADGAQVDPPGFHLQPLPFADDVRGAALERAFRAGEKLKEAARTMIGKLTLKNGAYQPDSYPNPALALFWGQLEARAFQEEYDAGSFGDMSMPRYDPMHKRAGGLMQEWKAALNQDEGADHVIIAAGAKRKADVSVDEAEMRSRWDAGTLDKLKNDQLKEFLRDKNLSVSGKKADLVERAGDWFARH
ncbi:Ku DNA-binding complex Ku70 subunit [Gautieria morchelliformis]|nr:Ku DNA-binding complex Ku70 subunit [Gautieria morchelliformis]